MKSRRSSQRSQLGVALFASLMILLVLSVLGIAAMRMLSSQAQVASGSLGAEISYSVGASAINMAINNAESDLDARVYLPRVGEAPKVRCLGASSTSMPDCSGGVSATADARGISQAAVTISTIDTDADTAAQAQARLAERVRRFGSMPGAVVEYFTFESAGEVSALDISTTQVQETFFPHL